jgi:hypothetical protein
MGDLSYGVKQFAMPCQLGSPVFTGFVVISSTYHLEQLLQRGACTHFWCRKLPSYMDECVYIILLKKIYIWIGGLYYAKATLTGLSGWQGAANGFFAAMNFLDL